MANKILYPSKEWESAVQKLKSLGKAETTSNIRKMLAGEFEEKTLPPAGDLAGTLVTGEPKELPETGVDNLTAMRLLTQQISQNAYQKRMGAGMQATMGGMESMGFDFSKMSGGITANIIKFVESRAGAGATQQLQTMETLVSGMERRQAEAKQTAMTQLGIVLETPGAILNLDEDALAGIANTTGISIDSLTAIQEAEKANEAVRKATEGELRTVPGVGVVKIKPDGTYQLVVPEVRTYAPPASYQEWSLAGGEAGTGLDYAGWLGGKGLTPEQIASGFKLADDYSRDSKDFLDIEISYNKLIASAQDPSAAGDLSIIFSYMKMLDPTSVVREGEQATAESARGVPAAVRNTYNRIMVGEKLEPSQRKDFVDTAGRLYNTVADRQDEVDRTYIRRGQQLGVPTDLYMTGEFGGDVEQLRSQLQFGEVLVRNKETGEIGAIFSVEYNPQIYELI